MPRTCRTHNGRRWSAAWSPSLAAKQEADPAEPGRLVAARPRLRGAARDGQGRRRLRQGRRAEAGRCLDPVAGSARAADTDHAPTDKLPPRVIGLLKHIEATDPEEPLVLWYLGMAAAQDAHIRMRLGATGPELLTKLPAGGEDTKMVQSALDALSQALVRGMMPQAHHFVWHLRVNSVSTRISAHHALVMRRNGPSPATLRISEPWPRRRARFRSRPRESSPR